MKDKTKNLEKAFSYVRSFYNEIAQMLSDVMELMSKKGWESPGGGITDGLSYALDNPDHWMCFYIYKNFINKKVSSNIKGILIYFNEYMNEFPISVVCGKLNQPRDAFNKWGLYWLVYYNKNKLEDLTGEAVSLTAVHKGESFTGDIFAIPLSEILTPEDVKDKIVKKLLAI
jgi:hypothetical protein